MKRSPMKPDEGAGRYMREGSFEQTATYLLALTRCEVSRTLLKKGCSIIIVRRSHERSEEDREYSHHEFPNEGH